MYHVSDVKGLVLVILAMLLLVRSLVTMMKVLTDDIKGFVDPSVAWCGNCDGGGVYATVVVGS